MKTSKKDYELFQKECRKWINIFGLLDWEPYFLHGFRENGDWAWCNYSPTSRGVTFALNKDWKEDKVTNEEIKITAFHEVAELLIGPLYACARYRFLTEDRIEEAAHSIIRTLENVVYPRLK